MSAYWRQHAQEILSALSGRTHSVYTGLKLMYTFCGHMSTVRLFEVTEVRRYRVYIYS
jgi:predicted house-cleaning NTP pyrophosphatase (Maf/HAM1 superfamily)